MAGRKSDTASIQATDLACDKLEVEAVKLPKRKIPELDPPYNPMGMAILNNAKKGMEYQGDKRAGNKRADRMQEAIEDFQQAMNQDED